MYLSLQRTSAFSVVGYDADEEQLQMLKDGTVDGLLVQNPFGMGYASVIAAARAAIGAGNEAYEHGLCVGYKRQYEK